MPDSSTDKEYGIDQGYFNDMLNRSNDSEGPSTYNTNLFGIPHQFLSTCDYRISNKGAGSGIDRIDKSEGMGRKFLQEIVSEAPLVTILPGKARFLPDYKKADKELFKMLSVGVSSGDSSATSALKDLMSDNNESRYFDFESDYSSYINYVNIMCRVCSMMLGLGENTVPGTNKKYRNYDWSQYKYWNTYKSEKEHHSGFFDTVADAAKNVTEAIKGTHQYLSFYVDPSTSFNESSSNETTKSQLEGKFDQMESIVKEIAFFGNAMAIKSVDKFQSTLSNALSSIGGSDEGFFQSLFGRSSEIVNGSNLIFPEIWGDAAYNKSYTITIDLKTPYGDKESIFLNIFVPMLHALALALPRQTSANTYSAPFLVKMFSKGWFSCEMGIVDHIQIEKGPEQSWSIDGLPTAMKIQLSVKDMYSNLMMAPSNKPFLFFSNQGMMEFLGATCGVDLSRPNMELKLQIGMAIFLKKYTDIVPNTKRSFFENIANKIQKMLP